MSDLMEKMVINDIINQVDKERIYQIVTQLEGPRHPLDNMDALNAAADCIFKELTSYGLKVETQEFKVERVDDIFKNVIGYLGDQSRPPILLGSHYDTRMNCPGANDNLSAVAISLEVARVLAQMEFPPSVIIAAFTLEEEHPGIVKQIREDCLKHGIFDSQFRFTSAKMQEFGQPLKIKLYNYFQQGNDPVEAIETVKRELKEELSEDENIYLNILIKAHKSDSKKSSALISELIGSHEYVKKDENFAGYIASSGSGGTLAAGYYLKTKYLSMKIAAAEALQCPTLFNNGYGDHRI